MVRRCQDGCDVEEDGDGRLNPGGVPQNEINGEGNQLSYAATSEREDQDGDCLAFLCLSCHVMSYMYEQRGDEMMRLSGEQSITSGIRTFTYTKVRSCPPQKVRTRNY